MFIILRAITKCMPDDICLSILPYFFHFNFKALGSITFLSNSPLSEESIIYRRLLLSALPFV